jgi:hypothetical protein
MAAMERSTIYLALGMPTHCPVKDREAWREAQTFPLGSDHFTRYQCGDDAGYGVVMGMLVGGRQCSNNPPLWP